MVVPEVVGIGLHPPEGTFEVESGLGWREGHCALPKRSRVSAKGMWRWPWRSASLMPELVVYLETYVHDRIQRGEKADHLRQDTIRHPFDLNR